VRLDHLLSKENLRTYAVLLTHKEICVLKQLPKIDSLQNKTMMVR